MGKQNKRVKAEHEGDVIFDTEVKKKQKKEKNQAVGVHFIQAKNEPVDMKAEDVFVPNVEQAKKQQQKQEKHQAVGDLTIKVKDEPVEVKVEGDVIQKKKKQKKQQGVGDPNVKLENERVEVKTEGDVIPNTLQKKKPQQKKAVGGKNNNEVKTKPIPTIGNGYSGPVSVSVNVSHGSQRKKKEKTQTKEKELSEKNVQGHVVGPTSNGAGKKRKRKQKKKQKVVDENVRIDAVEKVSNVTGEEIKSIEAVTGSKIIAVSGFQSGAGKKRKRKQEKKQEVINGNVKIVAVENVSSVTGKEIREGFETVTGSKTIAVSGFQSGAGKKRKRKQEKKQEGVNGNVKIVAAENVLSVTGKEIREGFETVTGCKTIAVRGFQSDMKEKKIFNLFRSCGFITEINMSTVSEGEKISGLAYIEFEAEDAAKLALGIDGTNWKDRTLKVELSKVQVKKKDPPAKISGCKIAYIGNLPRGVKEDDIRQFFKDSKIESIDLALYLYKQQKGLCRGFGHVIFADDESLENAMKKNNVKLCDRPIKVAYPTEKYTEPIKKKSHGV